MPLPPGDPNYRYSVNSFIADGSQTVWEFNFAGGYLSRDHVRAFITPDDEDPSYVSFTWVSDYSILISPAVAAGVTLTILRDTPKNSPIADFTDGSVVTELTLDTNARQAVYLAQEALDRAQASLSIGVDDDGDFIALGYIPASAAALLATSGGNMVGFSQDPTALAKSAALKLQERISPCDHPFNAVGDGVADDLTAVRTALIAAAVRGVQCSAYGKIFGISGSLTIDGLNGIDIEGLSLKQLAPNSATRKTLYFTNCGSPRLSRVHVDRNGVGTEGALNSSGAIWFDGCSNPKLLDCSVTGAGRGNGIVVWNCTNPRVVDANVYDMFYDDPSATDDALQAIWFSNVVGGAIVRPRVKNLHGNSTFAGLGEGNMWFTRGVVLGGCRGVRIESPDMDNVDQGVDLTGSAGNLDCVLAYGYFSNMGSCAVKFSNSAVRCRAFGFVVNSVGLYGGVMSGPSEADQTYKTQDCVMHDFTVYNAGYNHIPGLRAAAFSIQKSDVDFDYPKGCEVRNVVGIDPKGVPTMAYVCDLETAGYDAATGQLNTCINPQGYGYIYGLTSLNPPDDGEGAFGFHMVKANSIAVPGIANETYTALTLSNGVFDGAMMLNGPSLTAKVDGIYRSACKTAFTANATGYRHLAVTYDATPITQAQDIQPGNASLPTVLRVDTLVKMRKGKSIQFQVYQNSGGSLDILPDYLEGSLTLIQAM